MKRSLILLIALTALAGCASLSESECRAGDWRSIGVEDGSAGYGFDRLEVLRSACSDYGITPNAEAWEAGRQQGLEYYCTPTQAWKEGARGRPLSPVCGSENAALLERENFRGLTYRRIEKEIRSAENDIDSINRSLATLARDHPARAMLIAERNSLRLRILRLRAERTRYTL